MPMSDSLTEILALPSLSVIDGSDDVELARIRALVESSLPVGGRGELEWLLGRLLACDAPPTPKTLDLIGHSTGDTAMLSIGGWVVDATSSAVSAFFRELADQRVLPRLGVHAVRLIGSLTAETARGRLAIRALSGILGIPVWGARDLIHAGHFARDGYADARQDLLVSNRELERDILEERPSDLGALYVRALDLDALPAEVPAIDAPPWPELVATADQARALLAMVHRDEGVSIPGLLSMPHCEIALPSCERGAYHHAEVLLCCDYLRVYPEGRESPGILYPIVEPAAVRRLIARLAPRIRSADAWSGDHRPLHQGR